MRIRNLLILLAATALAPAATQAQGVVIGETVGIATDEPPGPVITYVERETIPSVTVPDDVVVGTVVPDTVVVRVVPDYERYGYAIVNDRPIVVEPQTRRVMQIIER